MMPTDTVETFIPFQTIGVNVGDTIGILFFLNNFQNFKYTQTGFNHLNPSTWGSAILRGNTTELQEKSQESQLRVFPNPCIDQFNLDLGKGGSASLRILDMSGKERLTVTEVNQKTQLDLSELSSGIYFLEVIQDNRRTISKLIKR